MKGASTYSTVRGTGRGEEYIVEKYSAQESSHFETIYRVSIHSVVNRLAID